jgi:guanylate kinase
MDFPWSNFLYIGPPSLTSLRDRLAARGTETEQTISTRLTNSYKEVKSCMTLPHVFQYRVINGELELASQVIKKLVRAMYFEELGL